MSRTENLKEFHRKIGAPIAEIPTLPGPIDQRFSRVRSMIRNCADSVIFEHNNLKTGTSPSGCELAILRLRLMMEELAEIADAMADGDMIGVVDGLADLDYVVTGTSVTYGIPPEDIHQVVHESNMSKTAMDENSKGGKGEGYFPPEPRLTVLVTSLMGDRKSDR